ncbi:hypothetical protein V6N11_006565 [Hibiscus sabdariffa]|uniref:Uncharacterized protein n=1 Tax=Hibiscus sabdariffa TaxID=183260 RepID=A0ABR2RRJ6_9ROSI
MALIEPRHTPLLHFAYKRRRRAGMKKTWRAMAGWTKKGSALGRYTTLESMLQRYDTDESISIKMGELMTILEEGYDFSDKFHFTLTLLSALKLKLTRKEMNGWIVEVLVKWSPKGSFHLWLI